MKFIHKIIRKNTIKLYLSLLSYSEIKKILYQKNVRRVLDVGVGSGISSNTLSLFKKFEIEGLDIKNNLWPEYSKSKITLYDGKSFPYKKSSFDLILIFFVLHHALNPLTILKEAARVSSKYILILEEIKTNPLQNSFMSLYDKLTNLIIFGRLISSPRFKTNKEWLAIFKKEKIEVKKWAFVKEGLLVKRVFYLLKLTS